MSASLRYVPAASSTLQIEPASQPSSSVQRRRIRSSRGRSENSPARSSATAIRLAARAATRHPQERSEHRPSHGPASRHATRQEPGGPAPAGSCLRIASPALVSLPIDRSGWHQSPGVGDVGSAESGQACPGGRDALMPEGLDPIETGKKLHEHGEETDRQAEGHDDHRETHDRHSRIIQIAEAVLLSIVTITAAWAGYSAARWGTASRVEIARSSTLRNLATRDDLTAISLRNFDASTFNAWFTAFTLNSPQKEAIAIRRFRPAFLVAFNAWMATDPLHNPHAPPGPTYMPQYKLPAQAQANALDNQANAKFTEGTKDGVTGDDYVQITVFLAAVLFLVGIGSSFRLHGVRYALITFGTVLLIVAVVLILRQPGLPPD